jgi:DNA polymerase-1
MDLCINKAREDGFVSTLNGRKRFLRDIHSKNWTIRAFAERTAINTPIQGTAADIIKMAMISVYKSLNQKGFRTKMLLQVHDELLFEAPVEELEAVKLVIKESMEKAFEMLVPLEVNIGVGKNWLDAH